MADRHRKQVRGNRVGLIVTGVETAVADERRRAPAVRLDVDAYWVLMRKDPRRFPMRYTMRYAMRPLTTRVTA